MTGGKRSGQKFPLYRAIKAFWFFRESGKIGTWSGWGDQAVKSSIFDDFRREKIMFANLQLSIYNYCTGFAKTYLYKGFCHDWYSDSLPLLWGGL